MKRILKRIFVGLLIFIASIFLITTITINTPLVRKIIVSRLEDLLNAKIVLKRIHITPLSAGIYNFGIIKNNKKLVGISRINVTFNPFKLKNLKIKSVYISGLNVAYTKEIQQLIPKTKGNTNVLPLKIKKLRIKNSNIKIRDYSIKTDIELKITKIPEGIKASIKKFRINVNGNNLIKNISGDVSLVEEGIVISNMKAQFKEGEAYFAGLISDSLNLDVVMRNIQIKNYYRYIAEDVSGNLNLNMKIFGKRANPTFNGNIYITNPFYKNYRFENVNLSFLYNNNSINASITIGDIVKGLFSGNINRRITGKIDIKNLDIFNYTGIKSDVNGSILIHTNRTGNGNYTLKLKKSTVEDLVITDLFIQLTRKYRNIVLQNLSIKGKGISINSSGFYSPESINIALNVDSTNIKSFNSFLPFGNINGTLSMNINAQGKPNSPSIKGNALVNEFEYKEFKGKKARITINLSNLQNGNINMSGNDFYIGKTQVDSFILNTLLKENLIHYDISALLKKKNLFLKGKIKREKEIDIQLDTLLIRQEGKGNIINRDPIIIVKNRKNFEIKNFSILGPGFQIISKGTIGEQMDATINISSTDLRKIGMYSELKHILKGSMDMYVNLKGNNVTPVIGAYGVINNFQFDEASFDSISILMDIKDNYLNIYGINLIQNSKKSSITGNIPFDFKGKEKISMNEPLNFDLSLNLENFGNLLGFLKSQINIYRGSVTMNISGRGTMNNPILNGNINFSRVSFRIPQVDLRMENFNGSVNIKKRRATIDIKNKEKSIVVNGGLRLDGFKPELLNIKTKIDKFHIKNIKNTEALLSGIINLSGNIENPQLKGNIDIHKIILKIPFQKQRKTGKPRNPPLDIDVTINMPKNVWIRNELVDIELGGKIRYQKKQHMEIEGKMNVLNGYLYYFDKPFKVEEGNFEFYGSVIPNINLKAKSEFTYRKIDEEGKTEEIRGPVVLLVSGTLGDLNFDLYTEPPLPPMTLQEIIPLLNLDMTWSELASFQRMSKTIPSKAVSFFLRTQLLDRIQSSLGIDALDLNANLFGEKKSTQITVGKYFTKNVYGSYTHDILSEFPDQFQLKYIMKKGNILFERDERGSLWGGFEVVIRR